MGVMGVTSVVPVGALPTGSSLPPQPERGQAVFASANANPMRRERVVQGFDKDGCFGRQMDTQAPDALKLFDPKSVFNGRIRYVACRLEKAHEPSKIFSYRLDAQTRHADEKSRPSRRGALRFFLFPNKSFSCVTPH